MICADHQFRVRCPWKRSREIRSNTACLVRQGHPSHNIRVICSCDSIICDRIIHNSKGGCHINKRQTGSRCTSYYVNTVAGNNADKVCSIYYKSICAGDKVHCRRRPFCCCRENFDFSTRRVRYPHITEHAIVIRPGHDVTRCVITYCSGSRGDVHGWRCRTRAVTSNRYGIVIYCSINVRSINIHCV